MLPFSLTLSGLQPDSRIRIYNLALVELAGTDSSGITFTYEYNQAGSGIEVFIIIHHINYIYQRIDGVFLDKTKFTIPVKQIFDRVYFNPP